MNDPLYEALPPGSRELLPLLCAAPELEGLVLGGGTALALQVHHRSSLDFDFAGFTDTLPTGRIDLFVSRLRGEGLSVRLITDPGLIARHKINFGEDLLRRVRDYIINGVKVTFFAHGRSEAQREFYRAAPKIRLPGCGFELLGLEGLKVAKTLVLADRVRSRGLFDLMILVRDHGYTVGELFNTVETLGTNDDPEFYKSVLRGEIPIDREDEGLSPVGVAVTPEELHAFFDGVISEYEIEAAARFFE